MTTSTCSSALWLLPKVLKSSQAAASLNLTLQYMTIVWTRNDGYTTPDPRRIVLHLTPSLNPATMRFSYSTMAPRVFYRVEDADSSARYFDGEGIFAADTDTAVHFGNKGNALFDQIEQHLDWSNRNPTPFISTYCDEFAARWEAERRVRRRKKEVTIYKIDMDDTPERREYRHVRRLAKDLGLRIETSAWHNSEHEWIFLHHVPDEAVVVLAE
jgi:hypothetical protein